MGCDIGDCVYLLQIGDSYGHKNLAIVGIYASWDWEYIQLE